jgi:hypothetical protein
MSKYPMTEVIAQREFDFVGSQGHTKVVASIGRPAIMPDAPHGDWYCPWLIDGPDRRRKMDAAGVDALQALLMALSGLRAELQLIARKGDLTLSFG